ncbi:MAG: sugar phosphate isomerase/epimerase [bacterium]|nr:sugar phosphate isomerase/epimerase [bacterium]
MKLGANSVLFGGFETETAFKYLKICGYDGIEISAIGGMSAHLVLDRWEETAAEIKALSAKYELPVQAMEQPSHDLNLMERAMKAAVEIGIPIINTGPGGRQPGVGTIDDPAPFNQSVAELRKCVELAERYGVTLCVKAHVGAAIWNTETSLRLLEAIQHPNFGLDMDPSHIWRGNEDPVEALSKVIGRIRHVHIRDCKGRQQNPGKPEMQANGRGDINLLGFIRVLHENGYDGALDLEVIGAKDYELPACVAIAAESRGHMQACLQACGAR